MCVCVGGVKFKPFDSFSLFLVFSVLQLFVMMTCNCPIEIVRGELEALATEIKRHFELVGKAYWLLFLLKQPAVK